MKGVHERTLASTGVTVSRSELLARNITTTCTELLIRPLTWMGILRSILWRNPKADTGKKFSEEGESCPPDWMTTERSVNLRLVVLDILRKMVNL